MSTRFESLNRYAQIRRTRCSPAQANASRINGRKSKGPKTEVGKRLVSENALVHGLYARKLRPDVDARYEFADFDLLLKQLLKEMKPQTQMELIAVETLAVDLCYQRQILELRKLAMAGDRPIDPQFEDLGSVEQHAHDLKLLERLVNCCSRGAAFQIDADELESVCDYIIDAMTTMRENAATTEKECATGLPADDEWVDQAKAYRTIAPEQLGVFDLRILNAVMGDREAINGSDRPRWTMLLEAVRDLCKARLEARRDHQEETDREDRRAQQRLLDRLPSLTELMKFECHARAMVRRTLQLFNASRNIAG